MCVIFYGTAKRILNLPLDLAWRQNDDGAGIIYETSKGYRALKGIMKLDDLEQALDLIGNAETVVHLRMATHGKATKENTHPFKTGKHSYLVHNGILHGLGSAGDYGHSDSAHLAAILRRLPHHDQDALLEALPGKFAHATPKGIELYGAFTVLNGVQCSNTYFLPITQQTRKTHTYQDWRLNRDDYTDLGV